MQLFGLYNWTGILKFMPINITPYTQIIRYVRLEAWLQGTKFDVNFKATSSVLLAQLASLSTNNFLLPKISFYDAVSTWLAGGTYWPIPFLQNAYAGPIRPSLYSDPEYSFDLSTILTSILGSSAAAPYLAGWYGSATYYNWWVLGTRTD